MIMLTRPEKFLIGAVAGGVVLVAGIVFLVAFLNGKLQFADKDVRSEPVVEERVEQTEAPQLPLPNPPLVTYTEGFPEGSLEDKGSWELIDTGDELGESCTVKTDEESLLDIRIRPGTIVRVAENTLFSLAALGQQKIALNMDSGMLISRVKKLAGDESFLFQTESAVAGIRGTELVVSVSEGDTVVYGMSGSIEVYSPDSPEKSVVLGLHQKTFVQKGALPAAPVAMSADEVAQFRKQLDSLRENQVFLVADKITFLPNSVQLTPEARSELLKIHEELKSVPGRVQIVGHTADIGDKEAQVELSTRRAQAVMAYLIELGLPASKLSALGKGSSQPVSGDPSLQHRNRRVEFVVESE